MSETIPAKRAFSAVQPTGGLHLGNYLGALKRFVEMTKEGREALYCVADLHAITLWQEPSALREGVRETLAAFVACGLKQAHNTLFVQSSVPAHAQLAWIFHCLARVGWMNRMTQFKEKAGRNRENASLGLYCYPVLMAADILLYRATHVPAGDDQKQHLELARDIAGKFNHDYGCALFPLPEPIIARTPEARVMSLRDGQRKMSKSDPSSQTRIGLMDSEDEIAFKIRKARTDPAPLPGDARDLEARPEAANLVGIHAALSGQPVADILETHGGKNFSAFKKTLTECIVESLCPVGREMRRLLRAPDYLDAIADEGREKACALAAPTLREAHRLVGLSPPLCVP